MVRGKVKLQWIINDVKRKVTFKRRLASIIKKVTELAILCDVAACLLVYGPGRQEDQPAVWPSAEEATGLLQRLRDLPDSGKFKKTLDGAGLLRQQIDKTKAKLYNLHRGNCDREINMIVLDFIAGRRRSVDDLAPDVFGALEWKLAARLQEIHARVEELRGGASTSAPPPLPPPQDALALVPVVPPPAPEDVVMVDPPPPAEDVPMVPLVPEEALMVAPLAVAPPPPATVEVEPYVADTPMTLDGEPRHNSYLFEVLDACDVAGDGSGIPTTEEMHDAFVQAGILPPPPPSNPPSSN